MAMQTPTEVLKEGNVKERLLICRTVVDDTTKKKKTATATGTASGAMVPT
jgi:hypothetical protein